MNKFVNFSFATCVFLPLSSIKLGFVDLYYYYAFIVILLPYFLIRYQTIDATYALSLLVMFVVGLINIPFGNNELIPFLKVFLGVSMCSLFFYYVIKYNNFNLLQLFKIYYTCAFVTAIVGLIQFFSFLVNFQPGYAFTWLGLRVMNPTRIGNIKVYPVHSITDEPAGFAFVEAAAIYIALSRILNSDNLNIGNKIQAVTIITAFLLSQSSTGYVIIFFSFVLIYLDKVDAKRVLVLIILSSSCLTALYNFVPNFKTRLDSSIGLLLGRIVLDTYSQGKDEANGSAVILYNHFLIARENFINHPLGTGLGSHHVAFERYNRLKVWFTGYGPGEVALNINDGCSLFNRLLSELGIIGIVGITVFIFKYYLKKGDSSLILINHASLVVILAALLRSGHYFIYGLPFFFFCYYYSSILNKTFKRIQYA